MIAMCFILLASIQSQASIISFNGQSVNALDLNGQVSSFTDFYDYENASAHTGLELVDRIIMFVAELNNEFAIFTIANKADAGGTRGLFRADIEATSGSVSMVDDDGALVQENRVRFDYAPEFTDGYIFEISEQTFNFTQTISSVSGQAPAIGVDGLQFIDFTDGSFGSANYLQMLAAHGDFSVNRVSGAVSQINAPATIAIFTIVLLGLLRRK